MVGWRSTGREERVVQSEDRKGWLVRKQLPSKELEVPPPHPSAQSRGYSVWQPWFQVPCCRAEHS